MAYEFISGRENDNIGLTLFGGEAFTQCPLTTDHAALLSMFRNVNCDLQTNGVIAPGTAIGMGLTNAVSKLGGKQDQIQVIILLTDGTNNTGDISPLTAAEIARQKQVRVYTIAVGKQGMVRQPVSVLPDGSFYYATVKSDMDPATLRALQKPPAGSFMKQPRSVNWKRSTKTSINWSVPSSFSRTTVKSTKLMRLSLGQRLYYFS